MVSKSGVLPSDQVPAYNALLNGLANAELTPEAFELFWEMRNRGLQPDEYTLCPLLKAASAEEDKRRVAHTWDELLAAGVVPTHISNSALVVAYVRCGAPEEALLVLDVMERDGTLGRDPDHARVAFNILLTCFSQRLHATGEALRGPAGSCGVMDSLLGRMRGLGLAPDAVTFNARMARCDTPEGINQVMRDMETAGMPVAALYIPPLITATYPLQRSLIHSSIH